MTASMTMTGCPRAGGTAGARAWRRGPGLLVTVLLLTGCPGATMHPDASSLASGAPPKSVLVPRPTTKPAVKPPVQTGQLVAVAPDTAPSAAVTPVDALASAGIIEPDTLVGLDQGQTRRLLGSPAATEEEAPAQVWRYADDACTLKVFFFMDMTSQDFRALSYDMKSTDNVRDADDRCFARLLAQAWNDPRDAH